MSLSLTWVGNEGFDRVAEARLRSYSEGARDLERIKDRLRNDGRATPGDYLLAEQAGEAVGTTTSLSMTMWVRGAAIPCQGVAWVGTIRTRRRTGTAGERGIASRLMATTLTKARERGQILSALMPFRCSFYEHFGYGIVEKRHRWIVPLAVLPRGDFSSIRFRRAGDEEGMRACRQACVEAGQCDLQRGDAGWKIAVAVFGEAFEVVDQPVPGGPIEGYMVFGEEKRDGRSIVRVDETMSRTPAAFLRQLHFLQSLRDQHASAAITLPADVPLNHLLLESQVPHRPVEHPAPLLEAYTRMQVRVMDHRQLLEAIHWPGNVLGSATIAVNESEGTISRFRLELANGRAKVTDSTAEPDVVCRDSVWASVVLGYLPASTARQWGLLQASASAAELLDACSRGPAPFATEYF